MKIKSILIAGVMAAIVVVVVYYLNSAIRGRSSQQNVREPVKNVDYSAKIREIEADFKQRERGIEKRYAEKFNQVYDDRETTMQKLDDEDEADRASFNTKLSEIKTSPYPATSGTSRTNATRRDQATSDYREKVKERDKASGIANDDYKLDMEYYQKQKELELSDLQKEKQRAIAAVYNQQASGSNETASSRAIGTVTAIASSDGTPMACIDGEVLKEGQSIHGVRILKIQPDMVEFGYADKTWSQRINEQPSTGWPQK